MSDEGDKITELDAMSVLADEDILTLVDFSDIANSPKQMNVVDFFESAIVRSNYVGDQVQRLDCAGEAWTTALDLSDGPMMVRCLWMAFQTTDFDARSWKLRITFDDAPAPQILTDVRISEMFGGGGTEDTTFRARFNGVTRNDSAHYSGYFKVPMPYQSSIKIDVYNPDDTNETCWAMLERTPLTDTIIQNGPPRDMHLYCEATSGITVANLEETTLLDVVGPAILIATNHILQDSDGTAWNFLEGDYRFYYDNEVAPSYRSSGTEDFYLSSWYFSEGVFANDDIVLSVKNAGIYRIVAQRFFRINEAPYGVDNLKVTWTNADSAPGSGNAISSSYIWYYK